MPTDRDARDYRAEAAATRPGSMDTTAGGFRSDVENLNRRAADLDDHAVRARGIAADLRESIESAGACWGRDEIGEHFASAHCGPAEQTLTKVDAIAGRLAAMGEALAASAETTRSTDRSGAESLGQLPGEV